MGPCIQYPGHRLAVRGAPQRYHFPALALNQKLHCPCLLFYLGLDLAFTALFVWFRLSAVRQSSLWNRHFLPLTRQLLLLLQCKDVLVYEALPQLILAPLQQLHSPCSLSFVFQQRLNNEYWIPNESPSQFSS